MLYVGDLTEVTFPTHVFRGPIYGQVFVSKDHHVYLLDPDDCIVRVFDAKGIEVKTIGGKGAGPGHFLSPSAIDVFQEDLYVIDSATSQIQVFNPDGKWLESIKVPRPATKLGLAAKRTRDNWFFVTSRGALVQTDLDFGAFDSLIGHFDPDDSKSWLASPTSLIKNPQILFALGPLKEKLFIFQPNTKKEILVFDTINKVFQQPIPLNIPHIRYDEEEGELFSNLIKDNLRGNRKLSEFKPPTHYPLVAYMHVNPDGILHIERGGPRGRTPKPLFLTLDGKEKSTGNPAFRGSRYIGKVGDWAYLGYPVDDEIIIHRIPHERVSQIKSLPPAANDP